MLYDRGAQTRLKQLPYKRRYSGRLHAHQAAGELRIERFANEKRLIADWNQPTVVGCT